MLCFSMDLDKRSVCVCVGGGGGGGWGVLVSQVYVQCMYIDGLS